MRMKRLIVLVAGLAGLLQSTPAVAASCAEIARVTFAAATITRADVVPAGSFVPPGPARQGGPARVYASLPSFCRVAATLTPTGDSDIKTEVWLPVSGWNGRFQALGNGGWTGSVPYPTMAAAVAAGYAAAGTDTGHAGNTASFALGHPEKVIDFGYRAVHEMTVHAKQVIDAFYGAAPKLSIWNGCSQGGRQGITEAVRYPSDYDAIVAGAPAVNAMHLHAGRMALNLSLNATPAGAIPAAKYPVIHQAVLAACDGRDGVADGVIENPASCRFDPRVLQCTGEDAASCLTAAQVESAAKMYAAVRHPRTGAEVLPGLAPGAELGWGVLGSPQPLSFAVEAYKYVVAQDAAWDASRFDPRVDIDRALAADNDDTLGSTNPDMKAFFARGGKLLLYHGWSDPQVTPLNTIAFFNKVAAAHGKEAVGASVQLYMVPGMNHCQGGPGTDTFDKVAALEEWVQTGMAPARITASHSTAGAVDRTRPLCPFGQAAQWSGTGSSDDAANFACVAAR
jgi:feruloyl esterase